MTTADPVHNLNSAFEAAEQEYGVPAMLDARHVAEEPNELAVMTYVSSLYHVLNEQKAPQKIADFQSEVYLIQMAEDCPDKCLQYLKKCLADNGLMVSLHEFTDKDHGPTYLKVQATFEDLCVEVSMLIYTVYEMFFYAFFFP